MVTTIKSDGPGVTTADVAKIAQVSVGTVFRVLNNEANVDDRLKTRVLEVVDQLGYVYVPKKRRNLLEDNNPGQTSERLQTTLKTVTFCVPLRKTPAIHEPYFYQVLHGAEDECAGSDISLVYTVLEDDPRSLAQVTLMQQRGTADGLVLVNYKSKELIEELLRRGVKLVLIDAQQPIGLNADQVTNDYIQGTLMAVQHLVGLGHQKIALINGPHRYSTQRRLQGYRLGLAEANLPYLTQLIVRNDEQTPEGGEKALAELLARGVDFSAVCCSNDNMAYGAVRALSAAGRRVPQDVSVVGYDDHGVALLASPSLTTINANTAGKGSAAIKRLIERAARPGEAVVWSVIPEHLVERASTSSISSF